MISGVCPESTGDFPPLYGDQPTHAGSLVGKEDAVKIKEVNILLEQNKDH